MITDLDKVKVLLDSRVGQDVIYQCKEYPVKTRNKLHNNTIYKDTNGVSVEFHDEKNYNTSHTIDVKGFQNCTIQDNTVKIYGKTEVLEIEFI